VAISIGVFTYSRRVMMTVGRGIMELTPVAALVVVWSHSVVLFLFASQGLERFLDSQGLPTIPLVPVSSSQAVVGAIIGIGLLKGGRGIRWRTIGGITSGWLFTPVLAALISFVSLFFFQNVFQQETYRPVAYSLTAEAVARVKSAGIPTVPIDAIVGKNFPDAVSFNRALSENPELTQRERDIIIASSEIDKMTISHSGIAGLTSGWITAEQKKALAKLEGQTFNHRWVLDNALADISPEWQPDKGDITFNDNLQHQLSYIYRFFRDDTD